MAGINTILSHPLLLLLLGGIITVFLAPYFTTQWQNHQKELEIQTNLAKEINQKVAQIVGTARYAQRPIPYPSENYINQVLLQTFIEWEISKSSIGSQIQSYFPNTQLKQEWDELSVAITNFAYLEAKISEKDTNYKNELCGRINYVLEIQEYLDHLNPTFEQNNPNNLNQTDLNSYNCVNSRNVEQIPKSFPATTKSIDWNILVHKELLLKNPAYGTKYGNSWLALENSINMQKDYLTRTILNSPIPSL